MNDRKSKLRVGIFVITATALLLIILFFLGLSEIFVRKICVVTTFTESVQGLSVGSDVKFRGVKIGNVKNVSIMPEMKMIKVEMAVESDRFTGMVNEQEFVSFIKKEMVQGLRCRLEFAGITGMKYVNMDYFTQPGAIPETPPGIMETCGNSIYIPGVSSSFKDIAVALTHALDRFSAIPFENISEELERTLHGMGTILADPALKATIVRISEASANLEAGSERLARVLSEERLEKIAASVENNLSNMDVLIRKTSTTMEQMKLPESAASFRNTTDAMIEIRAEFSAMINQVNAALEAFRKLCEQLNYDPGFIFGGKRRINSAE